MIKITIHRSNFREIISKGNFIILHLHKQDNGDFIICDEISINIKDIKSRDSFVSSLINLYYPTDRMDAIRNNYDLVRDGVAGDKTEEYTKEYLDMQEWRKKAKELADEIMKEV